LVADLIALLEEKVQSNMSQYQILFKSEPLEAVRHGKQLALKDLDIKCSDTLLITELGITLSVVNPQVTYTSLVFVQVVSCLFILLCNRLNIADKKSIMDTSLFI